MKKTFGITINCFEDSIELLEPMLKNIRPHVDHINIIYQKISNIGIPSVLDIEKIVTDLKDQGLIDIIFGYKPVLQQNSHYNELSKRNLGIMIAEENNIDYVLIADVDEFYIPSQFEYMKQYYLDNDIDIGYANMQTYYKSPEYCLETPETYFVTTFIKIKKNTFIKLAEPTPIGIIVDPTRNITFDKYHIFSREEVEMHHMSYVRLDISKKFLNSSARVNFNNSINDLIEYYEMWQPNMKAMLAGSNNSFHKLKKVDTLSHINFGFNLLAEK